METNQEDDCTTDCLLDYPYFKNYCKMIAIDLSTQQVLDADPRAIQQISFRANPDWNENPIMFFFFFIEGVKETILYFSQRFFTLM